MRVPNNRHVILQLLTFHAHVMVTKFGWKTHEYVIRYKSETSPYISFSSTTWSHSINKEPHAPEEFELEVYLFFVPSKNKNSPSLTVFVVRVL